MTPARAAAKETTKIPALGRMSSCSPVIPVKDQKRFVPFLCPLRKTITVLHSLVFFGPDDRKNKDHQLLL